MEQVFERHELKYRVTDAERRKLMKTVLAHAEEDKFGSHTIMSLYYDTPDFRVIRRSMDKPQYREKLRVRSYGTPANGRASELYIELKKKFKGVGYKRRTRLTELDIEKLISLSREPQDITERELCEFARRNPSLAPRILICYEREAYFVKGADSGVRITFDRGIRYRTEQPDVFHGSSGTPLIGRDESIMEVKLPLAMPLWLSAALDEQKIYPCRFSKCAEAYANYLERLTNKETAADCKEEQSA